MLQVSDQDASWVPSRLDVLGMSHWEEALGQTKTRWRDLALESFGITGPGKSNFFHKCTKSGWISEWMDGRINLNLKY